MIDIDESKKIIAQMSLGSWHVADVDRVVEIVNVALALIARIRELENALVDAIELAEHGWNYADEFYRKKWNFSEEINRLKKQCRAAP